MDFKILGRSPTLWIGLIVATISFAGTLGFRLLSEDQAGLWIALVNAAGAAVLALTVRPISPAAFTYLISAGVALAAGYGFNVTDAQVNALNGGIIAVLTLWTYGQVSPIETAVTESSASPTPEAAEHDFGDFTEDTVLDEATGA